MNQDESCVVVERQLPCFGKSTIFGVDCGVFLLICHVEMVDMLIYLYLYAVSLMNVSRLQLEYVYSWWCTCDGYKVKRVNMVVKGTEAFLRVAIHTSLSWSCLVMSEYPIRAYLF